MKTLQTVALGLVIVFLDVGRDGLDWVADPFGWVLVLVGLAPAREVLPNHRGITLTAWVCLLTSVLIWPPRSVAHVDPSMEWLFSLPTLAFGVLLAGALAEVTVRQLSGRFRLLRTVFVLAAALPVLIYGAGWDWLVLPTALLLVVANVMFVVWLWSASADGTVVELDRPEEPVEGREDRA